MFQSIDGMGKLGRDALPLSAEAYEAEYSYWPWGQVMGALEEWLVANICEGSSVVDYMCGTGYLLRQLRRRRPDLRLTGYSLMKSYVDYGQALDPSVRVHQRDLRYGLGHEVPQVALCMAGLHHLRPPEQKMFVRRLASRMETDRLFIVAEEVIAPWRTEEERISSVRVLWDEVTKYALQRQAPPSVIAQIDAVRDADSHCREWKLTDQQLKELMAGWFWLESVQTIWPSEGSPFGDRIYWYRRAR